MWLWSELKIKLALSHSPLPDGLLFLSHICSLFYSAIFPQRTVCWTPTAYCWQNLHVDASHHCGVAFPNYTSRPAGDSIITAENKPNDVFIAGALQYRCDLMGLSMSGAAL